MKMTSTLNAPWKRQRRLKKEHIPHQEQIIQLAKSYWDNKERALFILSYLTGGRVSEIVQLKHLRKVTYKRVLSKTKEGNDIYKVARNGNGSPIAEKVDKVEINYLGIIRQDVWVTEKKGKNILMVSMQNRKNKTYTRKSIPIPIDKEKKLVDMLFEYINGLAPEDPLFPFKIWKAEKIIAKVGMNPHFLRDIRLTHLVTMYDFNAFQLTKFAGWKDVSPAERYVRLGVTDLIDKF